MIRTRCINTELFQTIHMSIMNIYINTYTLTLWTELEFEWHWNPSSSYYSVMNVTPEHTLLIIHIFISSWFRWKKWPEKNFNEFYYLLGLVGQIPFGTFSLVVAHQIFHVSSSYCDAHFALFCVSLIKCWFMRNLAKLSNKNNNSKLSWSYDQKINSQMLITAHVDFMKSDCRSYHVALLTMHIQYTGNSHCWMSNAD